LCGAVSSRMAEQSQQRQAGLSGPSVKKYPELVPWRLAAGAREERAEQAAVEVAADTVGLVALVGGSVQARSIVL